jgi:hypothetical protein
LFSLIKPHNVKIKLLHAVIFSFLSILIRGARLAIQQDQAFVEIIRENEVLIYKITRVYTDTREYEQDLYQEIVYQLWKSFPSFRGLRTS